MVQFVTIGDMIAQLDKIESIVKLSADDCKKDEKPYTVKVCMTSGDRWLFEELEYKDVEKTFEDLHLIINRQGHIDPALQK